MRNIHDTNKQELSNFLKSIDGKLSHKITIVAIGGTALTLLDLIEIKFLQWGFPVSTELVQKVRSWKI